MQTLKRMNMVVNEDFYHMTTMDENINLDETSTFIVIFSPKSCPPPFISLPLLQNS